MPTCCITRGDVQDGLQRLPLFYAFTINMATLMTLCLLLIYMTERGKGSHHSWGNSHRYLQWNILHLLDMVQMKSESDERRNETNDETNCSKHNAFNNPFLSIDKELWQLSHQYSSKLAYSIYILLWHTLVTDQWQALKETHLMQHVK